MNVGLYQSAASLSALERWQDAVSQNITSGQVNGFKKRTVEVSAVPMGEIAQDKRSRIGDGQPALFPQSGYGISFLQGETQPTGNEMDVALSGPGFFVIQDANGNKVYTRTGELQVRADRTVVTSGNGEILSDGDSPIVTTPEGGPITINADGTVRQGTSTLGRLQVVQFTNPNLLIPIAGGAFIAPKGIAPEAVDQPHVLQGNLESSNVSPLREMVDLVTISRAYEANQKMIQSQDDLLGQALDKLG